MAERRLFTRGQPLATRALAAMLDARVPHALLLVGPAGVGKTTLALDLAAALLCVAPDPGSRPCRACRACRAFEHGNHPDLHRLSPVGPGFVIPIGGREERGVRDLVAELALLPVEGGARVAVIEAADRLTEDAQSALLKTLEEPPERTTLVLCSEEEERLLPTIRSRCVRLRLGPVARRDVEAIVVERGATDAAAAARAARPAHGRPGVALAYAAAPEAIVTRGEIARSLLDLRAASRTGRLHGLRDLAARAGELERSLAAGRQRIGEPDGSETELATATASRAPRAVPRDAARTTAPPAPEVDARLDTPGDGSGSAGVEPRGAARVPASERRAAALALVGIWRDVLRDLAAVGLGEPRLVRDTDLLDELETTAATMPFEVMAASLRRLDVAGEHLEGNVSPELVLDVLALQLGR